MAQGWKSGGRRRGTPNRRTVDAAERLEALGCDPLEGMAKIAMDERAPIELRARMYAELAPYLYPKRKAVEVAASPIPSLAEWLAELEAMANGRGTAGEVTLEG